MGIFKSLIKNLHAKRSSARRTFITISSVTPFPISPLPSLSHSNRFINKSNIACPLFLSSPPWKLCQLATPLYSQADFILFDTKVNNVFTPKHRSLPLQLGLSPVARDDEKEVRRDERNNSQNVNGFIENFINWPNFVSISRLISGPFLGWMIVNEWYSSAFLGLAISGTTDWLDGYLARRMNINSVVGSYLDPLADKVLIGCVALAMIHNDLLHPGLVGIVVLRDVALVGGAVYMRASSLGREWKSWYDFFNLDGTKPQKVEPLFISKVNTCFQLVLVAAALLQPEFGTEDTKQYVTFLSWLVASTTVASTAAYGAQYMKKKAIPTLRSH